MLVVIDYNVGNVRSVCNALRYLGSAAKLSRDPVDIENADGVILPGVAAFGYAARQLGKTADVIRQVAQTGKPLLGICVGCQLLFERSTEHGRHNGLGLIRGTVVPIPPGRTIPHMGWNRVELPQDVGLFTGLDSAEYFYFAHSYYIQVKDPAARVASTEYEGLFLPAVVYKGNIFGLQFHPEKSGPAGLKVLMNFEKFCRGRAPQC
jgi:glutamine amidotransferase